MPKGKLNPITSGDQILVKILEEVKGLRQDFNEMKESSDNGGMKEMYKCPECGKPYKSYQGLQTHFRKEHK